MEPVVHTCLGLRPSLVLTSPPTNGPDFLPSSSPSSIIFRHPGYPDRGNIIIRLPALDGGIHSENDTGALVYGIHHNTALWACTIIACGVEGILSPCRISTPASIVTYGSDQLLTSPVYYFYPHLWVSGSLGDLQYPVCPSFQDWRFLGGVPETWANVYVHESNPHRYVPASSQYSGAVIVCDRTCRLTGFTDSTEVAHIVPKKEDVWFLRNEMNIYNKNSALPVHLVTSDIQNLLLLRSDIHTQFDAGAFIIVPKCGTSRIHFIRTTCNYSPLLHNRETEPMDVSPEFLFSRFAWAILPFAHTFTHMAGVKVRIWCAEQNEWVERVQGEVDKEGDQRPPTKRAKLDPIGAESSTRSLGGIDALKQMGISQVDQAVDGMIREGGLHHFTPLAMQDSTPTLALSPPPHPPLPVPWTSPSQERYTCRKRIFDSLVAKDPSVYNRLHWHPDSDRLQELKEQYLSVNEPLHEQEAKRQRELMESGVILYEGEPVWTRAVEDGSSE